MVTTANVGALLATLARVDWVDFVLVGLMLLAAVHGLRLGALVQLLTFGGFWLGFLLGIFIFVPLFSFMHNQTARGVVTIGAGPDHGHWSGRRRPGAGDVEQRQPAPPSPRPRRLGLRGAGGRGGRAAVVVAGGQRDLVAQQPLHLAEQRGGPFGHPPLDRRGPPSGAVGLRRPPELPQHPGLPTGLLQPDPADGELGGDAHQRPDAGVGQPGHARRSSRSSARRAATSRRGRPSWSARAWWPPTPTWSPGSPTPW